MRRHPSSTPPNADGIIRNTQVVLAEAGVKDVYGVALLYAFTPASDDGIRESR